MPKFPNYELLPIEIAFNTNQMTVLFAYQSRYCESYIDCNPLCYVKVKLLNGSIVLSPLFTLRQNSISSVFLSPQFSGVLSKDNREAF